MSSTNAFNFSWTTSSIAVTTFSFMRVLVERRDVGSPPVRSLLAVAFCGNEVDEDGLLGIANFTCDLLEAGVELAAASTDDDEG